MEGEDDYYTESDTEDQYQDEEGDLDIYDDLDEEECLEEKNYTILKQDEIRRNLEDDIAKVSSTLSVPREASIRLLCSLNWSVDEVQDRWFSDEEKARKSCGLLSLPENRPMVEKVETNLEQKYFCGICLEDKSHKEEEAVSAACGHLFCKSCWKKYVSISIDDGRGCLMLRCPQHNCTTAVGEDMINSLASDEYKKKFYSHIVRSYIEDKKNIKWCPAPTGCDFAVQFVIGSDSNFVTCDCSYAFCWNCLEEVHSPADCETVAKWNLKNNSESENMNWILVHSKPCPSCKKPIEKRDGCNHMVCAEPCRFQFCWMCLGPWTEHGKDFYECNKFTKSKNDGSFSEEENRRENAKVYLEKYTHHYERWAGNHSSRQKALEDREKMKTKHMKKLMKIQIETEKSLEFIIVAWDQIVECRRVLKWSYAYGYYLPEEDWAKKELFAFLQGRAEATLEGLHSCAVKDFSEYVEAEGLSKDAKKLSEDFNKFRIKLDRHTRATRNYFDRFIPALGNNLSEVDS